MALLSGWGLELLEQLLLLLFFLLKFGNSNSVILGMNFDWLFIFETQFQSEIFSI